MGGSLEEERERAEMGAEEGAETSAWYKSGRRETK